MWHLVLFRKNSLFCHIFNGLLFLSCTELNDLSHDIAEEINRDRKSNQLPVAPSETRAENTGQSLPPPVGDEKALSQATLDGQLSAIKTRQDALKSSHDLELKQLETRFNQEKLHLEQQVVEQVITEQQKNEQTLALTKELDAKKITLERAFIEQSSQLEKAAIVAKIQSESNALASAIPSVNSLSGLIASGESATAGYNAYNKGTVDNKVIPSDKPVDLQALTIAEIQSRQALSITNQDRLGAVGKYQLIASTLKDAVAALKLSSDTQFDAATQERLFSEYLLDAKRPSVKQYITGKTNDINVAQLNLAQELAAVPNPATGKSYYDGKGGNKATLTTPQVQTALTSARTAYQQNVNAGMDDTSAYQQALSGGGTVEERQASMAKIKTLDNELVATEQERVTLLKSLGIDEQNATVEQSTAELEIKKTALAEQKALKEEQLQVEHDMALDAVAIQEQAAQQEVDLGHITAAEHLNRLKAFAADRLAIELKLLEEKRKLLKDDKLALAQNLVEQQALMRKFGLDVQNINNDLAANHKAVFEGMFAPFQNALQQMTNGVLTGQQTIANAVRNAANSILVSYASTFIQQRVMQAAQWAWQLTGIEVTGAKEKAFIDLIKELHPV